MPFAMTSYRYSFPVFVLRRNLLQLESVIPIKNNISLICRTSSNATFIWLIFLAKDCIIKMYHFRHLLQLML